MEKIVLIYPDTHNTESNLILPLSFVYLATPLKDFYDIHIIDQRVDKEWRETLKKELRSDSIVFTGISSMTGPQISGGIEAASIIKKMLPLVPIVWGGVHPSLLPEETINNDLVDIVVVGDGEETFKELVDVYRRGGDKKGIKGIMYKEGDSVVKTDERGQFQINRLDSLAYDLIEIDRYKSTPLWTKRTSLPIITSRGCPYRCAYCYNTTFSNRNWTALDAEKTFFLIDDLVKNYMIEGIFLLDDNFFVSLKRVKEICELLIRSNLNISIYNANCRADTIAKLDDEFFGLLKRSGFHQIYVGVESGSDYVLEKIKKDITVGQILAADKKLKKAGIRPFYSFMAGFPFETIDDIKLTLSLMRRLIKENSDAIVYKLQLFTPFPGTDLFEYACTLGMKFPETLEEWANYHYDKIHYNRFHENYKTFLEDLHTYTTYLDPKLSVDRNKFIKLIVQLYSWILKVRVERGYYRYMYELYPLKIARRVKNRMLGNC